MYTKTHKPDFLRFHRDFLILCGNRKFNDCQFIYHCIKSYNCFNIQFSGMDHMNTEILNLPFQTQLISPFDSLQINHLIQRKLRRKAVNPALFFPHIKQICI